MWKDIKFDYAIDSETGQLVRRVICGLCGDDMKEEVLP